MLRKRLNPRPLREGWLAFTKMNYYRWVNAFPRWFRNEPEHSHSRVEVNFLMIAMKEAIQGVEYQQSEIERLEKENKELRERVGGAPCSQ